MGAHLDRVIPNCASSRFDLRTLRAHGFHLPNFTWLREWPLSPRGCILHHHGGASPTRQIGRDSSASWRVLDGPGFFHLTFLHSTNLHGMLTLFCSGQSAPTRTTCRDTTSLIKDLQVTICARGPIVLPYLLKTPGTLFLGPFMVPC